MMGALDSAIASTRAHLDSLRNARGHWEGHLSSSALSTATAIVALALVDRETHTALVQRGAQWLCHHQNADGGWGDTTLSKSNLSTTLLCWSALHLVAAHEAAAISKADTWITAQVGSLEAETIARAVIARYGKDKTFSVPILMLCTLCGTLGENGWRHVIALPFELAALPRTWFGAVGLPVVSYALPALIAIGHVRFSKRPPAWWNPLRWLRALAWKRVRPMLRTLQPGSGGYLEATPLTSFVTMALAGAGDLDHPCLPLAVGFLQQSVRQDGAWPIDTNLATWGTTLAVRAGGTPDGRTLEWLLDQQYQQVHPFTNAAPGGWAWTDLPGGVPDADDTSSALIAVNKLGHPCDQRIQAGVTWLLDLQNRDGGMPTFCRGWGALPFDRSTPEITAHALLAWWTWRDDLPPPLQQRIHKATALALAYLRRAQGTDGSWIPLWFGNEHTPDENNPVYGTAQVMNHLGGNDALASHASDLIQPGLRYLGAVQKSDGSFGGDKEAPCPLEETAVALQALCTGGAPPAVIQLALGRLLTDTTGGQCFPPAPIGLYFARLWYHEQLYPVIWTLGALQAARKMLVREKR
ncbi:MAG: prenyltransferase/squalene oxidase repeat-containing protein [Prosthecobacter sp.]